MQAPAGLTSSLGKAAPAYLGLRVHTAGTELCGSGMPSGHFTDHTRKTLSPRRENTASRRPRLGPVGVDFGPREGLRSPETQGKAGPSNLGEARSALVEPVRPCLRLASFASWVVKGLLGRAFLRWQFFTMLGLL